jgi:hypothetical protein
LVKDSVVMNPVGFRAVLPQPLDEQLVSVIAAGIVATRPRCTGRMLMHFSLAASCAAASVADAIGERSSWPAEVPVVQLALLVP